MSSLSPGSVDTAQPASGPNSASFALPTPDCDDESCAWARSRLVDEFRRLGVRVGTALVIHSSLRRLGPVAGGARTILSALREAVGSEGLLVMPTYSHGTPFVEGGAGFYSPLTTPSESGALTEYFRTLSDVVRTGHPTHSFAAQGPRAEQICADHHWARPFDEDSPIGRLLSLDCQVLHLGTTLEMSAAKHLAETVARAPCLGDAGDLYLVRLPDGREERRGTFRYRQMPCPHTDDPLELERIVGEATRTGPFGRGRASLTPLRAFVARIQSRLTSGSPRAPGCSRCPNRPGLHADGHFEI